MRWLVFDIYLDRAPAGSVEGECPNCRRVQRLTQHALMPRWIGALLVFPSPGLLVCCGCGAVSRDETVLGRALSAVFLLPFLGILLVGVGTGVWLLSQMVDARQPDARYAIVAAVLISAGGLAAARALRTIRRLLAPRRMLPFGGWGTDL